MSISLKVEFEGGLENDFNAHDGIKFDVPKDTKLGDLSALLAKERLDPSKPTRFLDEKGQLLPGILIMINDVDSELEGLDYVLQNGDNITYISTLHGG